eukprot:1027868-Prorocentrum_lima.AAC.1
MTSSLVGSEMCIRDRMDSVKCILEAYLTSTGGEHEGLTAEASRAAEQQAVSYTHLTLPTICSV